MRRTNKTRFMGSATLLLMVVSVLILGHHGSALAAGATPEKTKLTIGLPGSGTSFLPNYVANRKGFYKEEGLDDVKILAFKGNGPTVQALAAGTIDLCVASLHGLVNTINAGQKFKAFWAGYNMTFFEWYAQPKYKNIKETKGGLYGVSRYGSLTDSLTRYILQKSGLDPEKDVKIMQSGSNATMLAALQSGKLDVGILADLYAFKANDEGFTMLISQHDDIAPDYPTHVVYAKEDVIAQYPNTLKAYLRATGKAMDWIKANTDEAAKILSDVYKFEMKYSIRGVNYVSYGWYADGRLAKEGMNVFWTIAQSIGDVKAPWPNSKWLDDSFLKTQDEWRK